MFFNGIFEKFISIERREQFGKAGGNRVISCSSEGSEREISALLSTKVGKKRRSLAS